MILFAPDQPPKAAPFPTPLHRAVAAACESNRWTAVNGFAVANSYTMADLEYRMAREKTAIADASAQVRYAVAGPDAARFVSRLTTIAAERLDEGGTARGLLLNDGGAVIDLVETARVAAEVFLLAGARAHTRHYQVAARGLDVAVEDLTDRVAAFCLIGPGADAALTASGVKHAAHERAVALTVRGIEMTVRPLPGAAVSGFEIATSSEEALAMWERLTRRGGVTPIGLDALEALRIEAGAPRPDVDFKAGDPASTPAAIGLPHLAPLTGAWFNGRRALRRANAAAEFLVTVAIDADRADAGAAVFNADGKAVGRVTSSAWSPALKRVVAFIRIAAQKPQSRFEIAGVDGAKLDARLLETPETAQARAYWAQQK